MTAFHTAAAMTLTVARLHALRVAVLLCVPGNGSHIGHVVTLGVGVGRVRRVACHIRGGRVVLWRERETVKQTDGERRGRGRQKNRLTASGDSLFIFITVLFVKGLVLLPL